MMLGTGLQAVAVTAGLRHTAAIMDDNTIRSWGYNAKGQLGVGSLGNVGDEANEMGDNMVVTELGEGLVPTSISAGGWHTCIILDGDLLKCWGELGRGEGWTVLVCFSHVFSRTPPPPCDWQLATRVK